jgi:hypothetical protein
MKELITIVFKEIIAKKGLLFIVFVATLISGTFLSLDCFKYFNIFSLLKENEGIGKFIFSIIFTFCLAYLLINIMFIAIKQFKKERQKINKQKQDRLDSLNQILNCTENPYIKQLVSYLVSNNLYKFSKEDIEQYRKETLPEFKENDFFNSMNFRIEKAIDLETFGYKHLEKLLEDQLIIQSKNSSYSFDNAIWKMLKNKK